MDFCCSEAPQAFWESQQDCHSGWRAIPLQHVQRIGSKLVKGDGAEHCTVNQVSAKDLDPILNNFGRKYFWHKAFCHTLQLGTVELLDDGQVLIDQDGESNCSREIPLFWLLQGQPQCFGSYQ